RENIKRIQAALNSDNLLKLQQQVEQMPVSDALVDYVYRLVNATRVEGVFVQGLSPRAGLALIKAAKAHAFIENRNMILPEDVQAVFVPVAGHRLKTLQRGNDSQTALQEILRSVAVA
ncbi:MAG: AAA family ATPase, partial [Neisseriaceae bacterium]|nr:AAA family ATPase [Neisseriaceae bacterium]